MALPVLLFYEVKEISMKQKQKSLKELVAEKKLKEAQAKLNRIRTEERKKLRSEQNHHKYMMGGVIVKYFPDCYDFNEIEMNRIIACAFSLPDVKNMIKTVIKERSESPNKNLEMEGEKIDAE